MDPMLTPGGSTGGETALLSLRGSLMGWGTVRNLWVYYLDMKG